MYEPIENSDEELDNTIRKKKSNKKITRSQQSLKGKRKNNDSEDTLDLKENKKTKRIPTKQETIKPQQSKRKEKNNRSDSAEEISNTKKKKKTKTINEEKETSFEKLHNAILCSKGVVDASLKLKMARNTFRKYMNKCDFDYDSLKQLTEEQAQQLGNYYTVPLFTLSIELKKENPPQEIANFLKIIAHLKKDTVLSLEKIYTAILDSKNQQEAASKSGIGCTTFRSRLKECQLDYLLLKGFPEIQAQAQQLGDYYTGPLSNLIAAIKKDNPPKEVANFLQMVDQFKNNKAKPKTKGPFAGKIKTPISLERIHDAVRDFSMDKDAAQHLKIDIKTFRSYLKKCGKLTHRILVALSKEEMRHQLGDYYTGPLSTLITEIEKDNRPQEITNFLTMIFKLREERLLSLEKVRTVIQKAETQEEAAKELKIELGTLRNSLTKCGLTYQVLQQLSAEDMQLLGEYYTAPWFNLFAKIKSGNYNQEITSFLEIATQMKKAISKGISFEQLDEVPKSRNRELAVNDLEDEPKGLIDNLSSFDSGYMKNFLLNKQNHEQDQFNSSYDSFPAVQGIAKLVGTYGIFKTHDQGGFGEPSEIQYKANLRK